MIRLAVAVALLAAACGTGESRVDAPPLLTTTSTSTSAPTTSTPATPTTETAAPVPLPAVTVEQVDCPAELVSELVACGLATVPLDRSDPAAGTTVVTLATLTGSDADLATPVAVLQGGPGGSSSDLAGWFPRQRFTQVFVDQRGVGFVGADFDCVEFDRGIPEFLTMPSPESDAAILDAYAACAQRLAGDPLLASADTVAHAADVADVMAALGYDRWMAYGVSYGSTIALELMRHEPEGLEGVVLDGVYPPTLDIDSALASSAAGALAELDDACTSDVDCARYTADVTGLLEGLIQELNDDPLEVLVDARDLESATDLTLLLDGQRLAEFVFSMMYSEASMRFLPGALAGIDEGDAEAAEWMARTGARTLISSQGANDEGTLFSVRCRERLPFTDGPPEDVGPFVASITEVSLSEVCEAWDREPAPASATEPVVSDLPALLLSGRFDPITPAAYAEDVAKRLGAATLVEQDGRGHGIWRGDDCIASIVEDFVVEPTSELDTSCAASGPEVDWARP